MKSRWIRRIYYFYTATIKVSQAIARLDSGGYSYTKVLGLDWEAQIPVQLLFIHETSR